MGNDDSRLQQAASNLFHGDVFRVLKFLFLDTFCIFSYVIRD